MLHLYVYRRALIDITSLKITCVKTLDVIIPACFFPAFESILKSTDQLQNHLHVN